jgi:hypothetical protein
MSPDPFDKRHSDTMAGVMETDQFAQQYAIETDDQLVQLAAEKGN